MSAKTRAVPASADVQLADNEQRALLRALRRCSLQSDYVRWEYLRTELSGLGYRVVLVRGVEHLRRLPG